MKKILITGGVAFLVLAWRMLAVSSRTPWAPQADFDLIGVLWLISNLPKLLASATALAFALLAGFCFVHAARGGPVGLSRLSARSEQQRMAMDPRFYAALRRKRT